jgi:hypothetical protein
MIQRKFERVEPSRAERRGGGETAEIGAGCIGVTKVDSLRSIIQRKGAPCRIVSGRGSCSAAAGPSGRRPSVIRAHGAMADDKTADYLAQEYLFLQKTIEEFDARALTIKAWSVTFSAAGLGLAYQQHNKVLLLVAAGSALAFWIVDAVWKYHQRAFYPRCFAIEDWFARGVADRAAAPFQVNTFWQSEFGRGLLDRVQTRGTGSLWKAWAIPLFVGVMMPHVVVCVAGVLLYLYLPPHPAPL